MGKFVPLTNMLVEPGPPDRDSGIILFILNAATRSTKIEYVEKHIVVECMDERMSSFAS